MAPAKAANTSPAQRTARTSTRCSTRIFFTLASRSGTTRIVYDLSNDPPLPPSSQPAAGTAPSPPCQSNGPGTEGGRSANPPQGCVQYRILGEAVNCSGRVGWGQIGPDSRFSDPSAQSPAPPQLPSFRSVDDDDGNVVLSAAIVGQLDERLAGLLGAVVANQLLAEIVVLDQVGEAVGAEQVPVAGFGLESEQVDQHVLLEAHRPGDDVLQPAVARLVGSE